MQANVHITPMRASRALALRYLATKFSTDTENIAVHSCQSCYCFPLTPEKLNSSCPLICHLATSASASATRTIPSSAILSTINKCTSCRW